MTSFICSLCIAYLLALLFSHKHDMTQITCNYNDSFHFYWHSGKKFHVYQCQLFTNTDTQDFPKMHALIRYETVLLLFIAAFAKEDSSFRLLQSSCGSILLVFMDDLKQHRWRCLRASKSRLWCFGTFQSYVYICVIYIYMLYVSRGFVHWAKLQIAISSNANV